MWAGYVCILPSPTITDCKNEAFQVKWTVSDPLPKMPVRFV